MLLWWPVLLSFRLYGYREACFFLPSKHGPFTHGLPSPTCASAYAFTTIKKSEPTYTIASPIGFRVTLLAVDFSFSRPRSLIVVLRNVERTALFNQVYRASGLPVYAPWPAGP
jgi:hypothetical protein